MKISYTHSFRIKFNIKTCLFYIFWTMLLIGKGLGYTSEDKIFVYLTAFAIIFAALKLVMTRYSSNELLACIVLNALGVLTLICSHEFTILLSTITITALKDVNLSGLLKYSFWMKLTLFVLVTSSAILGYSDMQIIYRYENGAFKIRYALGYAQPNATHFTLFVIFALCILAYQNKIKFYHYALMMIYNYFIFRYTDSRTGVVIVLLLILCSLLVKGHIGYFFRNIMYAIANKSFVIIAAASVLFTYLYANVPFFRTFGTFSSRFMTAYSTISESSLSLFGRPGITTDLGMISVLYGDGIIVFLMLIVGYYVLLTRLRSKDNVYLLIICSCYALYCISEAYIDSVLMNISLLYFGQLIYRSKSIPKINKAVDSRCID